MAFKTDTLKLRLLTSDAQAAGEDGELAVVNNVLRLRTGGTWANVSSGGGGGGASQLSDLSDVPSAPSSVDTIATVDGSNQLVFQKLTLDNIDASNLLLGAQGFVASDSVLMTSSAIENKIEAYGYATGNSTNWDTAYSWGDHSTQGYLTAVPQYQLNLVQKTTPMAPGVIQMGPYDNVLWVNVADLSGVGYSIRADDQYATGIRLTLVNASTFPVTFSPSAVGEWTADIPQLGLTNQSSFELEAYQKAILFRGSAAQIWEVIILPA